MHIVVARGRMSSLTWAHAAPAHDRPRDETREERAKDPCSTLSRGFPRMDGTLMAPAVHGAATGGVVRCRGTRAAERSRAEAGVYGCCPQQQPFFLGAPSSASGSGIEGRLLAPELASAARDLVFARRRATSLKSCETPVLLFALVS